MDVVIVGFGGHAEDIAHVCRGDAYRPLGYLHVVGWFDDLRHGAGWLGTVEDWCDEPLPWICGVNWPHQRKAIVDRRRHPEPAWNLGRWVHPDASLGPSVEIGEHTHINAGVTITRTTLGALCTIGPGANVCGDVTIGDLVTVGAGATVCHMVTIGDGATVGAGAVVLPGTEIPAGETWVGVPARPIHLLTPEEPK